MAAGEHLSKRTDRIADFRQYRHAVRSGAMCYSVRQSGVIETLSLSSRDTGRWIIPKGNIDEDERPYKAAKREAFEEAGVVGKIKKATHWLLQLCEIAVEAGVSGRRVSASCHGRRRRVSRERATYSAMAAAKRSRRIGRRIRIEVLVQIATGSPTYIGSASAWRQ